MNASSLTLVDTKMKMINYLHIVFFGFLILYSLYPFFAYSRVEFSWKFVSGLSEFRWTQFLNNVTPTSFYSIFYLLLPFNANTLLVLLALQRSASKASAYVYFLLSICALLNLIFYIVQSGEFSFDFRFFLMLLTPLVVGIPAFISGITNRQPLEPFKQTKLSHWIEFALIPLTITRKTIEYSSRYQSNVWLETLTLIVGLSVAAKTAEFIYEVLILATVIPIGGFIVIWVLVILLLILFFIWLSSHSEGTIKTTKKTTIFGRKYLSHTDDYGNEIARTETKEKMFGGIYFETKDSKGNIIARSEEKEKLFGGKYIEHRDSEGNKIGTSEEKETLLGEKIIEHRDETGKVISVSKKKKGLFGDDEIETTKK